MKNVKSEVTDFGTARAAVYDFVNQYSELCKYNTNALVRGFIYLRDHIRSSTPPIELREPTLSLLCMVMEGVDSPKPNTYRIAIKPTHVEMLHIGLDAVIDSDGDAVYSSVDALPKWVQERLATLMMMKHTPPTEVVSGVGKRISLNIFWVFKPNDSDATSVSV